MHSHFINKQHQQYNQRLLSGCALFAILLFLTFITLLASQLRQIRAITRYPGARIVSGHTNYHGLPTRLRWDDSYQTRDEFTAVYNWYSQTFELGAEARANERCIYLQGTQQQLISENFITVFICNTPNGQMVYVSRSMEIAPTNTLLPFIQPLEYLQSSE